MYLCIILRSAGESLHCIYLCSAKYWRILGLGVKVGGIEQHCIAGITGVAACNLYDYVCIV